MVYIPEKGYSFSLIETNKNENKLFLQIIMVKKNIRHIRLLTSRRQSSLLLYASKHSLC